MIRSPSSTAARPAFDTARRLDASKAGPVCGSAAAGESCHLEYEREDGVVEIRYLECPEHFHCAEVPEGEGEPETYFCYPRPMLDEGCNSSGGGLSACEDGLFCTPTNTCVPKLGLGESCEFDNDCLSRQCSSADGVCDDEAPDCL